MLGGAVGVVEQAQPHAGDDILVGAGANHFERLFLAIVVLQELPGFRHDVQLAEAAHLVHAQGDRTLNALGIGVILPAPGAVAAAQGAPVGDDVAVPADFLQQVILVGGEGAGVVGLILVVELVVQVVVDGIVGHDAASRARDGVLQVESAVHEGDQLRFEVVAGIHGELGAVVVAASLLRARADPVLHDRHDRVRAPAQVRAVLGPGGLHA